MFKSLSLFSAILLFSGSHQPVVVGTETQVSSLLEDGLGKHSNQPSVLKAYGTTPYHPPYGSPAPLPMSRKLEGSEMWTQKGQDIDGEAANDFFGFSTSLSSDGNTVAISAPLNDGSYTSAGRVRVFNFDGSVWTQKGQAIEGEGSEDFSGYSVSLSGDGDSVAIGASRNGATDDGHVRVYEWSVSVWIQKGQDIDGVLGTGEFFGYSIALSSDGSSVAIGAILATGSSYSYAGRVRVFEWDGVVWAQKGADIEGDGANDRTGAAVSISSDGNTVAIGADTDDNSSGTDAGRTRVYTFDGTTWTQKGQDINGEAANDNAGSALSLSTDGNTVAIGARYNDADGTYNAGHVRVYYWNGTEWAQKGQDINGEAVNDNAGFSVSLSSDGNSVAIGVTDEGAGYAIVFNWSGTGWIQIGQDIDGEAVGDQSGWSVSLSSDGSTVAIGAITNDGNGPSNAGHVRVFELPKDEAPPTIAPRANPTAAPTTVPSAVPTTVPTSVTIESPHRYGRNMREVWWVEFPDVSCYILEMDPQSWTPEHADFVRIFTYNNVKGTPVLQTQVGGGRLYKTRLQQFGAKQVNGEGVRVEFNTDNGGGAWGFKLTVSACPNSE